MAVKSKYVVTSKTFKGALLFEFDADGTITQFANESELEVPQLVYLSKSFPMTVVKLEELLGKSSSMKVELVPPDLSFKAAWDEYGYKLGNKKRAEKLWNDLTESQKIQFFNSLPGYNYYLSVKKIERLYLETYLFQLRFEHDYKAYANTK